LPVPSTITETTGACADAVGVAPDTKGSNDTVSAADRSSVARRM
jgi:hypothetical protein